MSAPADRRRAGVPERATVVPLSANVDLVLSRSSAWIIQGKEVTRLNIAELRALVRGAIAADPSLAPAPAPTGGTDA